MSHSLGANKVCLSVFLSFRPSPFVCTSVCPTALPPYPFSLVSQSLFSVYLISVCQSISFSLNERLTPSSLDNPAGHPLIARELRGGRCDAANCPRPWAPCNSCPCRQEKRGAATRRPAPACRRDQHQLRGREGDGAFRRATVAGTRILSRWDYRVRSRQRRRLYQTASFSPTFLSAGGTSLHGLRLIAQASPGLPSSAS
jgi:hypothetical protein